MLDKWKIQAKQDIENSSSDIDDLNKQPRKMRRLKNHRQNQQKNLHIQQNAILNKKPHIVKSVIRDQKKSIVKKRVTFNNNVRVNYKQSKSKNENAMSMQQLSSICGRPAKRNVRS